MSLRRLLYRLAASWMRPFLWAFIIPFVVQAPSALAEAVPAAKAELIRGILAQSIRSQASKNVRGTQMEWVQTPTGPNQISFKDYRRSSDGRSLTIVTDTSGRRTSIIADDGKWNRSYDIRAKTITVSRSMRFPTDEPSIKARVHRILSSYRVTYSGHTLMAARRCHKLTMDPHDVHGRPIRVWLDSATGVTLAREESDRRGFSFGMTAFTSIEYPGTISKLVTQLHAEKGTRVVRVSRSPLFKDPGSLRNWAGRDIILPLSMPHGFDFEAGELISLAGTPTFCLRYSDGLAMITIFQTQSVKAVEEAYQSVAWKMLPRGENVAVSGQTRVTSVVIGPRESEGIVTVARALDRQREIEALARLEADYGIRADHLRRFRDRGLGMDCIAALLEISRRSRVVLGKLMRLKSDGWTWRQIADRYRIPPTEIAQRIRPFECR